MSDDRMRARTLAQESIARGEPTAWFETLYREAALGTAVVPWDDPAPSEHLLEWMVKHPAPLGRALVVACGFGQDAVAIAGRSVKVTAFDIAATAIEGARARHGASTIDFVVGDLLSPPDAWRGGFDFVFESNTLQALPPDARAAAIVELGTLVAPSGRLLVVARAREPHEDEGKLPWPLTRAEIDSIAQGGLVCEGVLDVHDRVGRTSNDAPARRFVATFARR